MHNNQIEPQWKQRLPFVWIDAAAADALEKENMLQAALHRNDQKFWFKSAAN